MIAFILFSEPITNALGWALVHTLWQGTLLAAVTALALRLAHQQTASVRYGISIGALSLQLLAFIGSLWFCYEPVRPAMLISGDLHKNAVHTIVVMNLAGTTDWVGQLTFWLNRHLPLFVTLWLSGAVFLFIRLMGGWLFVQRLTRRGIQPAPKAWQDYLTQLGGQLGITQVVRLVESTEISVPMTIGWLKPVVLIPIGLLAGLSPRQVEAVLAHELAHIRRYDYLVNLIQSAVEIILFFHPAIWWLSARVREEREHACDDVAIRLCGERTSLAQALVHIEERRQALVATPALAMAFGARKQSFLQRVKRVIGVREQPSSSRPNGLAVTGCFLLLAGLVTGQHMYRTAKNRPERASETKIWKADTLQPAELENVEVAVKKSVEFEPVVWENDTLDPKNRQQLENELERREQELERLEIEMEKLTEPLEKLEGQYQIHERDAERIEQEMEKLHGKMEKLHRDLEQKLEESVALEEKKGRLNGKLSESENQLLAKLHADVAEKQKQLQERFGDDMTRMQEKLQQFQERMRMSDDSMKAYWEEATKQMNANMPHLIKLADQYRREMDSLRGKAFPAPALPPTPEVPGRPARPAPALAPARPGRPAPVVAPTTPARPVKPAGVKGQYWYNGKRYDRPEDMPKAPEPPVAPATPDVPAVAAPAAVPASPTPPLPPAVEDAPEGAVYWKSDDKPKKKNKTNVKPAKAPKAKTD
ncbi:M56 family metallopeptidase [Larkinella sp. VNQ87]|uniref:M56 family metallopeptidase n=1 Tax=Larkinella sp. VNQ87 TaxID=3400921 RepID=UPI003C11D079